MSKMKKDRAKLRDRFKQDFHSLISSNTNTNASQQEETSSNKSNEDDGYM